MGKFCHRGVSQNNDAAASVVLLKEEKMTDTYDKSHARALVQGLMQKPAMGEAALFKRAQSFSWGEDLARLDLASTDSTKTVGTHVEQSVQHVRGLIFKNGPTSRNIVVSRAVETQQLESQSYLIDSVSKKDGHLPISVGSQDRVILDLDSIGRDLSVDLSKERDSQGKLVLITGGDGVEPKTVFDPSTGTAYVQVGARRVTVQGLTAADDLLLTRSKGHLSRGDVIDAEVGAAQTRAREASKPVQARAEEAETRRPPEMRDSNADPAREQAVKALESEVECQREAMKHAEAEIAQRESVIKEQAAKLQSLDSKVAELQKMVEALAKQKGADPAPKDEKASTAPVPRVDKVPMPKSGEPSQQDLTTRPKAEGVKPVQKSGSSAPEKPASTETKLKEALKPAPDGLQQRMTALKEQGFVNEDPNYPGFLYKSVQHAGQPDSFVYQNPKSGETFSMRKGNGSAYVISRRNGAGEGEGEVVQIRDNLGNGDIIMSKGEFDGKGVWHSFDSQYMAAKGYTKVDASKNEPELFVANVGKTLDHKYYPRSGTFVLETTDEKHEEVLQVHASTPDGKKREELWNKSYWRQPAIFDSKLGKYRPNYVLFEHGKQADEQ